VRGYPRRTRRGPVEATSASRRRRGAVAYPRRTRRGPVEAFRRGQHEACSHATIRDVRVAAPLKHALNGNDELAMHGYPRRTRRGPVEATRASTSSGRKPALSATYASRPR